MSLLLDGIYLAGTVAASPYLLFRMATSEKYRHGFGQRLGAVPGRSGDAPCLWLHAASVGEVLAMKSLLPQLAAGLPAWSLVVSTTTRTGQEVAAKNYPDQPRCYYPVDFSWAVRRALSRIRPNCIALMEREIWPNFVGVADRAGVPVVVLNGRLSERSFRTYRFLKPFLTPALRKIRAFSVQSEAYAQRLRALGVDESRIHVTGSVKYDNVSTQAAESEQQRLRELLHVSDDDVILLGGSTHRPEERALLKVARQLSGKVASLRLVLVPRHLERIGEVEKEVADGGFECLRFQRIEEGSVPPEEIRTGVILVDTVGQLATMYSLASVVFVGGSLIPHGGQNIIEPAGLGKPVLFGPHIFNFQDTADLLLARQAAKMVTDEEELLTGIESLLADPGTAQEMGNRARIAIESSKGATGRNVELLQKLLL